MDDLKKINEEIDKKINENLANEIGVRSITIDNREIKNLLLERSEYVAKQYKIVKQIKKLQEDYEKLQKEIGKYKNKIVDLVYKNYLNLFNEYEDIFDVRLENGSKVVLRLKDAVEEIKKLAKNKFLEARIEWENKNKNNKNK